MTSKFSKVNCADCIYHECICTCVDKETKCDGMCTLKNRKTRCYKSRCNNYKFDMFFSTIQNMIKED